MKGRPVHPDEYTKITPKFIKDNEEPVRKMAELGCTNKEIAHILNITIDQVKHHYKKTVEDGRSHLRKALRRAQLESAIKDRNTGMLIWLGKNYLDQREPKHHVQHGGGITIQPMYFGQPVDTDEDKVIQIEG